MNRFMKFAALIALIAVPATAAVIYNYDRMAQFKPVILVKGLMVGPEKGIKGIPQSDSNIITAIRVTPVDYDFPTIPAEGAQGGTLISADIAVDAGLLANDDCHVVGKARYDGGLIPQIKLYCYVKAYNVVVMTVTNDSRDAGTFNPPDSGYEFWTTSHITQ